MKSFWAVAAGVLVIVVVTTLVDVVLHAVDVFPPMAQPIGNRLALLATSYRVVISVGGAWLTARLAPDQPMKHAMILGGVGTVLGLIGVAATWNLGLGRGGIRSRSRFSRSRSAGWAADFTRPHIGNGHRGGPWRA